jgi:hypothetical protein
MEGSANILPPAELDRMESELRGGDAAFLGRLLLFSWWVHGGEPGPGHVSEAFRLVQEGGKLQAVFLVETHDLRRRPPARTERFAAGVEPGAAARVLRQVLQSGLFARELPEEKDRQVADILKETWRFHHGAHKVEKTLFAPFPAGLEPLRSACRTMIDEVKRTGTRSIVEPRPRP